MKTTVLIATLFLLTASPAEAQFGRILEKLGIDETPKAGNDEKTASGLKEALKIGTEKAVSRTGQLDGCLRNEAIKILLPGNVQKMEGALKLAGFGPQLDEFVVSMNRAAEKAAPFAKDIFWNAIKEMSFADDAGILRGGDTAATDYFEEKTSDPLREAFHPIVEKTMSEVGVTQQYAQIVGRFETIPFMKADSLDINRYVVGKALFGLFHVLGEEEKKIRTNPAARVTDLLKEVFGR